jgi:hypothetical protein
MAREDSAGAHAKVAEVDGIGDDGSNARREPSDVPVGE